MDDSIIPLVTNLRPPYTALEESAVPFSLLLIWYEVFVEEEAERKELQLSNQEFVIVILTSRDGKLQFFNIIK